MPAPNEPDAIVENISSRITKGTRVLSNKFSRAFTAGLASCDERGGPLLEDELLVTGNKAVNRSQTFSVLNRPSTGSEVPRPKTWGSSGVTLKLTQMDEKDLTTIHAKMLNSYERDVDCKFIWKRKFGDSIQPIHIDSSSYTLSANDIGARLVVEAISTADSKTCFAEIGPFEVDSVLRSQLEGVLFEDKFEVPCVIHSNVGAPTGFDTTVGFTESSGTWTIHLFKGEIQLIKSSLSGRVIESSMVMGPTYPNIEVGSNASFTIKFSDTHIIKGGCNSRRLRDLLVLGIRCVQGKLHLGMQALFELVTRQNAMALTCEDSASALKNPSGDPGVLSDLVELIVYIERLACNSHSLTVDNSKLVKDLKSATRERDDLQLEIEATIESFNKMISQRDPSNKTTPTAPIQNVPCLNCTRLTKENADIKHLKDSYKVELEKNRDIMEEKQNMINNLKKSRESDKMKFSKTETNAKDNLANSISEIFDIKKKLADSNSKVRRLDNELEEARNNFKYAEKKLLELRKALKDAEMDKTQMTTMANGYDPSYVKEMECSLAKLTSENNTLKEKIRKLATS